MSSHLLASVFLGIASVGLCGVLIALVWLWITLRRDWKEIDRLAARSAASWANAYDAANRLHVLAIEHAKATLADNEARRRERGNP